MSSCCRLQRFLFGAFSTTGRTRQQALHGDLGAGQFVGDQAIAEDQHTGADGRHFLEIGRDDDQRAARLRALGQLAVDLALGADVHARGRLLQHDERLVQVEPARQHHLLLVAAGELLHLGGRRGRIHVEALDERHRGVELAAAAVERQAPFTEQRRVREQVFLHAHRAGEVFFEPLAGHAGDAGADGV